MTKVINLEITSCSLCPYIRIENICSQSNRFIPDEKVIPADCPLPQKQIEYQTTYIISVSDKTLYVQYRELYRKLSQTN